MLENAIDQIFKLRQVKNNADLEQTKMGQSLIYSKYLNLLFSAAMAYDNQSASKKLKRIVFMHSFDDSDGYIHYDDI
jgi:hypothetical protein